MTRFKAVFFDVDGTLYRSREYEEHLLQSAVTVISEILGIGRSEAFRRLMEVKKEVKTVSKSVEILGINRSKFYERLAAVVDVKSYITTTPTVVEMLRWLRQRNVIVGLHTNAGKKLAMKVLMYLGIDSGCYDFIVTSDDAEPKPDLSGYLLLLEKAGVKPYEALYVGDRCEVEIAPAKRINMHTAAIYIQECPYADYFLKDIAEVKQLI